MKSINFINNARALLGMPYSQVDCIGVIRKALEIECQGTNWLYRSIENATKYRYLNERFVSEYREYLVPGMVLFKVDFNKIPNGYIDKPDAYHIGVYTENNTVIHSPGTGKVVCEIPFNWLNWQAAGKMKQVDYSDIVVGRAHSKRDYELTDHEMIIAIYNKLIKD